MKDLFQMSIEKLGLEMTIINLVVATGITLIYMRVFINFKDAKRLYKEYNLNYLEFEVIFVKTLSKI